MPLQKLQLRPGLYREGTIYSNSGGWFDGDKIRFRSGLCEKIGGWTQVSPSQYNGTCRALWVWSDAGVGAGNIYIGVGTSTKYYIYFGGIYNDITPIVQTDTLTNPFSTTNGSTTVTVTDASYTPNTGDFVLFNGTYTVGGVTISGEYVVQSVGTTNTYTITVSSAATSTTTGGGSVSVSYEYPSGLNNYTVALGWGAGPWSGYYGSGSSLNTGWGVAAHSGVGQQLRLWSNDNFGADLVIAPRGGPVFYWQDANGVSTRAQSLKSLANATTLLTDATTFSSGSTSITITSANAPYVYPYMYITGTGIPNGTYITAINNVTGAATISQSTTAASSGSYNISYAGAFVPNSTYQVITSAVQQFIICFGANSYVPGTPTSSFNPMLVRWSDQANAYQWIPEITNQSGEYTLSNGSQIMGARATRQEILVWTDSALYSMQYIGAPYVWGFQILMDNISVISPNCMITVNNISYWMGRDRFFYYDGTVKTLPCALKQYVFDDINQNQSYQVFAGANEGFNEIWWFYCSSQSSTVNKYVIFNYVDQCWYYGTMARTAWYQTGTLQYPIAADYNSRLLYHENGTDDVSTSSPQPINAYIQSSDVELSPDDAGQHFGFVWRMIPDINFNGSTVNNPTVTMQLLPRQYSGSAYGTADNPSVTSANNYSQYPEYTVQQFTGQVYTRLRGRQMAFRISSNTLGVAWQLGTPRFDIKSDGRR